jgi:hypothetical protein
MQCCRSQIGDIKEVGGGMARHGGAPSITDQIEMASIITKLTQPAPETLHPRFEKQS